MTDTMDTKSNTKICGVCFEPTAEPEPLNCHHVFCKECINQKLVPPSTEYHQSNQKLMPASSKYYQKSECQQKSMPPAPKCPSCASPFMAARGNQPPGGRMKARVLSESLPSFTCKTIEIKYIIPSGVQGKNHPAPGLRFCGTQRTAYLPDSVHGRHVLSLLRRAFDAGLTFTIGDCKTTGAIGVITWNIIHHKTSFSGMYGYPDPTYLSQVMRELAAQGIY